MLPPTLIAIKNIGLKEFNLLSGQEREQIIFGIGSFINSKHMHDRVTALYAVNSFFVEIEYDLLSCYISNIRAVQSGDILAAYSL